ncbi:hypothetical protein [Hyalangium rubrum]|uniref:Uncharacterized protein n=1 Tax=Hyalangium rubrum TaxID=3103134 RepID=A0ABU5GXY7_9BACT|nr:hypothetical protein [Hyalangium sp. s54d21]MDY7226055.1 hypothetical protein [Hyalangium sp. s54d21]
MRDTHGASTCAQVYGPDCQRTPCPDGRKCLALFIAKPQAKVWTQCFPECGKDRPPCAKGLVCDRASCLKPCEPDSPDVCAPGYRCLRLNEQQPWLCRPDM